MALRIGSVMHYGMPCLVGEGKSEGSLGVQGVRQGDPTFFHFCTLVRRKMSCAFLLKEVRGGGRKLKPPSSLGDADGQKKKKKKKSVSFETYRLS